MPQAPDRPTKPSPQSRNGVICVFHERERRYRGRFNLLGTAWHAAFLPSLSNARQVTLLPPITIRVTKRRKGILLVRFKKNREEWCRRELPGLGHGWDLYSTRDGVTFSSRRHPLADRRTAPAATAFWQVLLMQPTAVV
jgi:hypothetical protein